MKNPTLSILFFLSAVAGIFAQGCPDTIRLQMDTSFAGTDLIVHIKAEGFADIISVQGSIRYDADVFRLKEVSSPLPDFGASSWAKNDDGELRILWYQLLQQSVTFAQGTEILTLRFDVLQQASTSFIGFSTKGFNLEFSNSNFEVLCVEPVVITASSNGIALKGRVIHDDNKNCTTDTDEEGLQGWILEIDGNGKKYYRVSDEGGNYEVIVPAGTYTVRAYTDNALWTVCDAVRTVSVAKTLAPVDFHSDEKESCYKLVADISTTEPYLKPCSRHRYSMVYENRGTSTATDAYIEVMVDEDLTFVSSDFSDVSIDQNKLTFMLGDLAPGVSGRIQMVFDLACNVNFNEAVCLTARAYPFLPCSQVPGWTGALLEVDARCDATSGDVSFAIRNAGTGPMSTARSYIVTEDDVLRPPRQLQLDAGEELILTLPADGSTYRLTADQDAGFPFASTFVTQAIEGCTAQPGESFSTGYVTLFEESDRDAFIDTECREVRNYTERVAITGSPKGYNSFHKYIEKTTHLEYTITFRHLDLDTIRHLMIKNHIPEGLDISTFRLGATSHPCTYRINQERELIISFDSIGLTASGLGNAAGFVKYKIVPDKTVKDGDIIYNDAEVIFGLEERVAAAAREKHTIGTGFLVSNVSWTGQPRPVRVFPNPSAEWLFVGDREEVGPVMYRIMDERGISLLSGTLNSTSEAISLASLAPGGYAVSLEYADHSKAVAKIIK